MRNARPTQRAGRRKPVHLKPLLSQQSDFFAVVCSITLDSSFSSEGEKGRKRKKKKREKERERVGERKREKARDVNPSKPQP